MPKHVPYPKQIEYILRDLAACGSPTCLTDEDEQRRARRLLTVLAADKKLISLRDGGFVASKRFGILRLALEIWSCEYTEE